MIAETVRALLAHFPMAEVLVADDGSRDRTAELAEGAGATVLRLRRRGKGQALSAAERAAPPGRLLLCDADLRGDLRPLLAAKRGPHRGDLSRARRRRPRGREGRRPAADPVSLGVRGDRAALRAARALLARPPCRVPARAGVRLRDTDDDRRRAGGARRPGGRARRDSPCDRPRRARLSSPGPPAARPPARLRTARDQLPRGARPPRRLDRSRCAGPRLWRPSLRSASRTISGADPSEGSASTCAPAGRPAS